MNAVRRLSIAAIAAAVLLSGCTLPDESTPGAITSTAVSPVFNAADLAFVRTLIPNHQTGIAIAELGAKRATDQQTQQLAAAIVSTQRDEVDRLQGWLNVWKQPPVPTAAPDPRIAKLAKTPAAGFDKAFVDLLIAQQTAAVKLARTEAGAGKNTTAIAYARQVDASRTAEIEQLRKIR